MIGIVPTVLADASSYTFTANVTCHAFGIDAVTTYVKTANGYTDEQDISTQQPNIYWTFNIPPNEGDSTLVYVHTDSVLGLLNQNCEHFTID